MPNAPSSHSAQSAPVYVVNLARAADRRALMRQECAGAGVDPTFVEAVDARDTDPEELYAQFATFGPWGIVPLRNMAICQSHRRAWMEFLQTDAAIALILEDDIHLAPELGHWINDLSWWPAGADMVKVERWPDPKMVHVMAKQGASHLGRRMTRIYTRHPGAAAYFVTRAHAERLLAVKPIRCTTDGFLFNPYASPAARKAVIYQVDPAMVEQGNEPADKPTTRLNTEDTFTAKGQSAQLRRRQSLNRAWCELRALPRHLARIATGQARITKLSLALGPLAPLPDLPRAFAPQK